MPKSFCASAQLLEVTFIGPAPAMHTAVRPLQATSVDETCAAADETRTARLTRVKDTILKECMGSVGELEVRGE